MRNHKCRTGIPQRSAPCATRLWRADTLKRHLSTHKAVAEPEKVEDEKEMGDFREAAIALWQRPHTGDIQDRCGEHRTLRFVP